MLPTTWRLARIAAITCLWIGAVSGGCKPRDKSEASEAGAKHDARRAAGKSLDVDVPADFLEHKAPDGTISVKAPPPWTDTGDLTGHTVLSLEDETGMTFSVLALDRVSVSARDPKVFADGMVERTLRNHRNFSHVRTEYFRVAGVDSARMVFENDGNETRRRTIQVVIPAEPHTYVVTYSCALDRYDRFAMTFDQMLASLKIAD